MKDIIENIFQSQHEIAKEAIHKEVSELTDEERFAIAIVAGIPIKSEIEMKDGNYILKISTKRPVNLAKIGNRFHVYELTPNA